MDYAELQEKFPFLSCVRYANNEYVGILQNQDQFVTTIYVYDNLKTTELKQEVLDFGEIWWWESNRTIPINIFLKGDFRYFRSTLVTLNSKDIEIVHGPTVKLSEISKKRVKRRTIQLVRKPT